MVHVVRSFLRVPSRTKTLNFQLNHFKQISNLTIKVPNGKGNKEEEISIEEFFSSGDKVTADSNLQVPEFLEEFKNFKKNQNKISQLNKFKSPFVEFSVNDLINLSINQNLPNDYSNYLSFQDSKERDIESYLKKFKGKILTGKTNIDLMIEYNDSEIKDIELFDYEINELEDDIKLRFELPQDDKILVNLISKIIELKFYDNNTDNNSGKLIELLEFLNNQPELYTYSNFYLIGCLINNLNDFTKISNISQTEINNLINSIINYIQINSDRFNKDEFLNFVKIYIKVLNIGINAAKNDTNFQFQDINNNLINLLNKYNSYSVEDQVGEELSEGVINGYEFLDDISVNLKLKLVKIFNKTNNFEANFKILNNLVNEDQVKPNIKLVEEYLQVIDLKFNKLNTNFKNKKNLFNYYTSSLISTLVIKEINSGIIEILLKYIKSFKELKFFLNYLQNCNNFKESVESLQLEIFNKIYSNEIKFSHNNNNLNNSINNAKLILYLIEFFQKNEINLNENTKFLISLIYAMNLIPVSSKYWLNEMGNHEVKENIELIIKELNNSIINNKGNDTNKDKVLPGLNQLEVENYLNYLNDLIK
ncbi:unnamed protein product [[Candida] boidinii]|uniref:Unnamed protein product n=1 Tax=Candida boidinii TaxID=5477 RepID=A0A9W6SY09_CANBO|nr:unnamed protein product [[Candida] boidinii]